MLRRTDAYRSIKSPNWPMNSTTTRISYKSAMINLRIIQRLAKSIFHWTEWLVLQINFGLLLTWNTLMKKPIPLISNPSKLHPQANIHNPWLSRIKDNSNSPRTPFLASLMQGEHNPPDPSSSDRNTQTNIQWHLQRERHSLHPDPWRVQQQEQAQQHHLPSPREHHSPFRILPALPHQRLLCPLETRGDVPGLLQSR